MKEKKEQSLTEHESLKLEVQSINESGALERIEKALEKEITEKSDQLKIVRSIRLKLKAAANY